MANKSTLAASTRAEWLKFRTVRSSILGVVVTIALTIGLGVLVAIVTRKNWNQLSTIRVATFDPVSVSLVGTILAQFAVGVIGALFITTEYSSGSIRTTLAAVPNRFRLITSKVVVLTLSIALIGEVTCVTAFLIAQQIFRGVVPTASLSNGPVLRSVMLAGLYLTLLALLGFALGLILRQSASSISVFVAVLLIVPLIGLFLPQSWQNVFSKFEPSTLGQSMESPINQVNAFGAWSATGILLGYIAVMLTVAMTLFERRDAGASQ